MYNAITASVLNLAANAVGAPVPKDISTRDDWRDQHVLISRLPEEGPQRVLPSEAYFLNDKRYTPFQKDGKSLLQHKEELRIKLNFQNFDNYIIRDEKDRIIATTDDFKGRMVINIDKPRQAITIDNQGVKFGKGVTVENIRTGEVSADGCVPHPSPLNQPNYQLDLYTHSMGSHITVKHNDPIRMLNVVLKGGGPASVDLGKDINNVDVTLPLIDKPDELETLKHTVFVPSALASKACVSDTRNEFGYYRRTAFTGKQMVTEPSITIKSNKYGSRDDSKENAIDFVVRDEVPLLPNNQAVTYTASQKLSYAFSSVPNSVADDFGTSLKKSGEAIALQAQALETAIKNRSGADKQNSGNDSIAKPMLPPVPVDAGEKKNIPGMGK